MIEHHFVKYDYLKGVFYPVLLGLVFVLFLSLFWLIKALIRLCEAKRECHLNSLRDYSSILVPPILYIIAGICAYFAMFSPLWPVFKYGKSLPFESEENTTSLCGKIESFSGVPNVRIYVGDEIYINQSNYASKQEYTSSQAIGPCFIRIGGEEFFIITAEGFEIGMTVEINYLPKTHMILDCVQVK